MDDSILSLALNLLVVIVALTWCVILLRGNADPKLGNFSLQGLIMTRDGFIDRVALMELGTWISLTLVLIGMAINRSLTEWFVLIYAALPSIRAGQSSWLKSNQDKNAVSKEKENGK